MLSKSTTRKPMLSKSTADWKGHCLRGQIHCGIQIWYDGRY